MQKFQMIADLSAVANDPVLADFIAKEMAMLAKKNSGEKKPTPQQTENATIRNAIVETMEDNRLYTISELMKEVPGLPESMTNQRMSALLHQLVDANFVERVEEKRKVYFRLV
jgi:hypothetical protein